MTKSEEEKILLEANAKITEIERQRNMALSELAEKSYEIALLKNELILVGEKLKTMQLDQRSGDKPEESKEPKTEK